MSQQLSESLLRSSCKHLGSFYFFVSSTSL